MHIIERTETETKWQTTDAEGRPMVATSRNADDGTAVEPVGGWVYEEWPTRECAICAAYGVEPCDYPAEECTEIEHDDSRDGLDERTVYACQSCVAAGVGFSPYAGDEEE